VTLEQTRTGPSIQHEKLVPELQLLAASDFAGLQSLVALRRTVESTICTLPAPKASASSCPHVIEIQAIESETFEATSFRTACNSDLLADLWSGLGSRYETLILAWVDSSAVVSLRSHADEHDGCSELAIRLDAPSLLAADELIDSLVPILVTAAALPHVRCGHINADSVPDPYSSIIAGTNERWVAGRHDMLTKVTGYYWSTLLSAGHIAALGGLGLALENAPPSIAKVVPREASMALVFISTETCSARTEADVRAWRQFLLPVLRPGFPIHERDWEEPVWLFEGRPVSERVADALVELPPSGHSMVNLLVLDEPESSYLTEFELSAEPLVTNEREQLGAILNAWFVAGRSGRFGRAFESTSELLVSHGDTQFAWATRPAVGREAVSGLMSALEARAHELDEAGDPNPYHSLQVRGMDGTPSLRP
jgi:hypothetical protein